MIGIFRGGKGKCWVKTAVKEWVQNLSLAFVFSYGLTAAGQGGDVSWITAIEWFNCWSKLFWILSPADVIDVRLFGFPKFLDSPVSKMFILRFRRTVSRSISIIIIGYTAKPEGCFSQLLHHPVTIHMECATKHKVQFANLSLKFETSKIPALQLLYRDVSWATIAI